MIGEQQGDDKEFFVGEVNKFVLSVYFFFFKVDRNIFSMHHVTRFVSLSHCLDAQIQFLQIKWLCEIIVCAILKSLHLVFDLPFGSCHNDRNILIWLNFITRLRSVTIWQHSIHDDAVKAIFFYDFITLFKCGDSSSLISRCIQIGLHGIADIIGIFYDKYVH